MRVLLVSQYFTPEVTAASARIHAFAAGLAARGHEVEVVCEVPSHPAGVIEPEYRRRAVARERLGGFRVNRVWVRATPRKSARARIANYASFAAMATIAGATLARADVVLASSPPLPVGSVGAALAIRHRAPWVLDVRDLWPEVAVLMGELGEGRALRAAERLERRLYRSAAAIVTVTEPFRRQISERGGDGKVELIANGAAPEFLEAGGEEPDREAAGLSADRFVWSYAGNLGKAQGLEAAIEAAGMLGNGFELVLTGAGPMREELRARASRLPPGSVSFREAAPAAEVAGMLRAADALLVPLAAWTGLSGFVPSKLFDCCAVGRPVIAATPGEANRLAEEAGAALAIAPGDPLALADAVRRLRDEPELADSLSAAGRAFGEANARERGVDRLESLLERVAAEGR